MAWEYRNVLIGGQVKFAGGRWSCEALRDRRGQRVAIRYQEEVKSNLDRGDLTGLHELYYPEVWTAETQIARRQKLGTLQVVTEKSQAPAPAPILTETTECAEANDVAGTDLDADLLMRLRQAGYRWCGAKRTPDGRWHHLIAREIGWQRRARRERLEALIEAAMTQMTDRSDGAGPHPGDLLRRSNLAVPDDQAPADHPIAAALARDDLAEVEWLLEQQIPHAWTWGNCRGEAHRWRPGAGGGWESACGKGMPDDEAPDGDAGADGARVCLRCIPNDLPASVRAALAPVVAAVVAGNDSMIALVVEHLPEGAAHMIDTWLVAAQHPLAYQSGPRPARIVELARQAAPSPPSHGTGAPTQPAPRAQVAMLPGTEPLSLEVLLTVLERHGQTFAGSITPDTCFERPAGLPERFQAPIGAIVPGRYQPRKHFDETSLQELASSIAEHGVLTALKVFCNEAGWLELIAGERRLRAASMANLQCVPIEVHVYTLRQIAEISAIDNLQREDLTPLEEGEAYERLITDLQISEAELARRLGKNRGYIQQRRAIAQAAPELRQALDEGTISFTQARIVAQSAPDHQAQQKALATVQQKQTHDHPAPETTVRAAAEQAALAVAKRALKRLGWSIVERNYNFSWHRPVIFAANEMPREWSGAEILAAVREERTPAGRAVPASEPLTEAEQIGLKAQSYLVNMERFAPWVEVVGQGQMRYLTGDEVHVLAAECCAALEALQARYVAAGWTLEVRAGGGFEAKGADTQRWPPSWAEAEALIGQIEAGEFGSHELKQVDARPPCGCGQPSVRYDERVNGFVCQACFDRIVAAEQAQIARQQMVITAVFAPLIETASHEALRLLAIALMENGDGAAFGEEAWLGLDNLIGRLRALDAAGVRTILPRLLFRRLGSGSRRVAAAPLLAAVLNGEEILTGAQLLDPALAEVDRRLTRIEGWIVRALTGEVIPAPAALAGNRTNLEHLAAELEQITLAPGRSIVGVEELAERIAIAQDRLEDVG